MTSDIVKKASHTTFGKITAAKLAKCEDGRKVVIRVVGVATGTKTYTSQYGDGTGIVGSFQIINPDTGESVKSSTLYLPEVAMGPLVAAVAMGGLPKFAFDVIAKLDEESPVGFVYVIQDLVKREDDPLASLLAMANEVKPLALPAPGAAEGETPAPAPKPRRGAAK